MMRSQSPVRSKNFVTALELNPHRPFGYFSFPVHFEIIFTAAHEPVLRGGQNCAP